MITHPCQDFSLIILVKGIPGSSAKKHRTHDYERAHTHTIHMHKLIHIGKGNAYTIMETHQFFVLFVVIIVGFAIMAIVVVYNHYMHQHIAIIPLTHCGVVIPYGGKDQGRHWRSMLTDGTKPLPEPTLTNPQEGVVAFTWRQFQGNAQHVCPWY